MENWKSQIVISNSEKKGLRKPPLVFTEQGVAMLSSVLHSDSAIFVNIQIIRVFTRIRKLLETHSEILRKLEKMQKNEIIQDEKILIIFEYLKQLEQTRQQQEDQENRRRIGIGKRSKMPGSIYSLWGGFHRAKARYSIFDIRRDDHRKIAPSVHCPSVHCEWNLEYGPSHDLPSRWTDGQMDRWTIENRKAFQRNKYLFLVTSSHNFSEF
jgi:hypothetical protein